LDFGSYQVGSGRLSGHLVLGYFEIRIVSSLVGSVIGSSSSDHFGFQIISGQVGLVIESSSVDSFQILNHIRLDRIRSNQISPSVSDLIMPDKSDQIEFLNDVCLSHVGFTLISIELNSFVFISSILNSSSSIQYKFYLNDMLSY
jgi:hypothetical protein